ncbi:MAG: hypothetical protein ISR76_07090 [Planctomycetes bacterium]|nr:hypothetical protein [Planctomycetota bacterium]
MAEKKTKRNRKDPGFLPGMAAASFVLVVWGIVALQPDRAGAVEPGSAVETAPSPAADPAPAPAARPAPEIQPAVPAWKQDERWAQAGEWGEDALDRIDREIKRHEDEGDPFRFRAEMNECRQQIERAVGLLDELAGDYQDDPAALHSIDTRRQRFEKKIRATRK